MLFDFDQAADFYIKRFGVDKGARASWGDLADSPVLLIVLLASLVVFECIFDHGYTNDETKWHKSGCRSVKVLQPRHHLQPSHEQKVRVRHL